MVAGRKRSTPGSNVDTVPQLSAVFRHHFFLACDFRLAELPFHDSGAFQASRGDTQSTVAEPLQDGVPLLIEPVHREFKTLQRKSGGNVHGDETARIVVDVRALDVWETIASGENDCAIARREVAAAGRSSCTCMSPKWDPSGAVIHLTNS